jgi:hypothetical protein
MNSKLWAIANELTMTAIAGYFNTKKLKTKESFIKPIIKIVYRVILHSIENKHSITHMAERIALNTIAQYTSTMTPAFYNKASRDTKKTLIKIIAEMNKLVYNEHKTT